MTIEPVIKIDRRIESIHRNMRDTNKENELLYAALNGIPDAVFIKDLNGYYIFVNDSGARLLGKSRDEVLGKNDIQLLGPEAAAEIIKKDRSIRESGQSETFEQQVTIGGEMHVFRTTKSVYRDATGQIAGVLGINADITSQKKAETALRQSEEQLSLIYNNTRDVIVLYQVKPDSSFRHVFVNRAGLEYPGFQPEDVIGKTLDEVFNAEQAHQLQVLGLEAIRRGKTVTAEIALDSPKYNFILEGACTAIFDRVKNSTHVLMVGRNITERKRKEQRQALLSQMSELLLGCLESDQSLREAARLIAREFSDYCVIFRSDDEGKPVLFEVAHRDPERTAQARTMLARRPPGIAVGSRRVMKSGKAIVVPVITEALMLEFFPDREFREYMSQIKLRSMMFIPLQARRKTVGAILFCSLKELQRYGPADLEFAEELCYRVSLACQNFKLYDEAQKSIRLRDEFLSIASHELKTPITPITLSLQLIERTLNTDSTAQLAKNKSLEILGIARHQLARLNRLIDELLDVSRITSGRLHLQVEPVDLLGLVQRIMRDFKAPIEAVGSSVEISSHDMTAGEWDPLRIEEVVINLIVNAIKFAPGKPIVIRIRGQDGKKVILEVQDFGIGIKKEDQIRIFERFERGVPTSSYGGFGLGLFISNQIVTAHGGSMRVESEVGKGSTFIVELPTTSSIKTKAA